MQDSTQLGPEGGGPSRPTLAEGTILAERFRIERLIGRGGMGDVYEVQDLVIRENVALKTIRSRGPSDRQLTSRFKKELQLSRHVSHKNVCRVFELWETTSGNGEPVTFFTMELLRGETLAQRIAAKGRLSLAEALPLIRQIASGLEEVHRLGIVHRDLKPANIFLVDDREHGTRAVVMDFGLARDARVGSQTETSVDVLMGTPVYMAPEQFAGGQVTTATDIHALGVTIFEMLTGRPQPLVAPTSVVADLPRSCDEALLSCFQMDPEQRPAIAQIVSTLEGGKRRSKRLAAALVASGIILAVLAAIFWPFERVAPRGAPVVTKLTFDRGYTADPAVSPDGKIFVYASDRESKGDLNIWLQRLDSAEATQLTDDPGNENQPAISPDGGQIVFRSEQDGSLYIQPISGAARRLLAKFGQWPRFSPDGAWITYWTGQPGEHSTASGQLWLVPASGGAPRRVAPQFADARYPTWSADSRRLLFRGATSAYPSLDENSDWWIVDISTGATIATKAWQRLLKAGLTLQDYPVEWSGDRVVFSARAGHSTNLWSIEVPQSGKLGNEPPQNLTAGAGFEVSPAVLPDGRIVYANVRSNTNIWRIALESGALEQVTREDSTDSKLSISKDGGVLVFGRRLGEVRNVWSMDLPSRSTRQLIANESAVPFVSPDGRSVAYSIGPALYLRNLASGLQSALCSECGELLGWNPDNSAVAFLEVEPSGRQSVQLLDLAGRNQRRILSGTGLRETAISPDGTILAFTSRSDGTVSRIYLKRFDDAPPEQPGIPITPEATWSDKPVWSEEGKRLFYASERDGFLCLWSQDVDKASLRAVGEAKAIHHFHSFGFSPVMLSRTAFSLAVAGKFMFVNVASVQGNIWALRP